jgi:hypothetical protein
MADGLLNKASIIKASIILTPTGYKAGTLYNVAPVVEPYEDFDFARASVASRVNSSGLVEMVGRTLGSELVTNGDFSELGSELVTNGDFATDSDWNKNDWDISNGVATLPTTSTSNLNQAIGLEQDKFYKIVFTVSNTTLGGVRVRLGTSTISSVFTDGTHTIYLEQTTTNDAFRFYSDSSGVFNGSIDNVSVKQVDPNDYWTKEAGWSIADGKAIVTNTGTRSIYQNIGTPNTSKIYKVNYQILSTNGGNFKFSYGGVSGTIRNTTGIFTEYIQPTSSSDSNIYFDALNVFTGSIDNVSVKEVIDTNNIPRISYDSNGQNGHILLEPTSTNLVTYSQQFGGATDYFNNYNQASEVSDNNLAPDGTNTATQIVSTGAGKLQTSNYISLPANTTYTLSFFAKNVDATEVKSRILANGGSGGSNLTSVSYVSQINTSTWTRITHTFTTNSTSQAYILYLSNALNLGGNIQLWGAQLEQLSYATSYIPTLTGSTVTRATETATGAGSSTLINSTEGVLYAEIAALADDETNRMITLSDGTGNNYVLIRFNSGGSNRIYTRVDVGSSIQYFHLNTSYNIKNTNKIAIKFKNSDFCTFINGTKVNSQLSGNSFSSNTLNKLNFDNGTGTGDFYGKCKAVAVFNEALSDSELTQLTT